MSISRWRSDKLWATLIRYGCIHCFLTFKVVLGRFLCNSDRYIAIWSEHWVNTGCCGDKVAEMLAILYWAWRQNVPRLMTIFVWWNNCWLQDSVVTNLTIALVSLKPPEFHLWINYMTEMFLKTCMNTRMQCLVTSSLWRPSWRSCHQLLSVTKSVWQG
jgi:hypothetical protein